ncbi:discoidin domain-containing protein, partial [Leeuwenhoekiella sp. UBA1003]|uniref:discoidin domain-containing protein n=1 Tax=Leeuwenhoekiella sp. UBA1003 TaxID=1946744 RepID=UPI0025C4A253
AITTVSRENRNGADSNEASIRVTDGDTGTKFLLFDFNNPEWIQQEFAQGVRVTKYSLTSANDAPGRDPVDWTLSGSNDGTNFTEIDSRTGQSFESRGQTREFLITNDTSYTYYRLDILANGGDSLFQLAEWRLFAE